MSDSADNATGSGDFDAALSAVLETERYGRSRELLRETKSTNDDARRRAEAGAPDGHLVLAERQSGGRGSHGRSWSSPAGGLYFSLVLRPRLAPTALPPLTLAAGLSLALAIDELLPDVGHVTVKWPNDVLIADKKCAGILVESATTGATLEHAIVGIGVNIGRVAFEGELQTSATSLPALERHLLLATFLRHFESHVTRLERLGPEPLVAALTPRLAMRGDRVRCGGAEGVLRGLDARGALRIEDGDGRERTIVAGRLERV